MSHITREVESIVVKECDFGLLFIYFENNLNFENYKQAINYSFLYNRTFILEASILEYLTYKSPISRPKPLR